MANLFGPSTFLSACVCSARRLVDEVWRHGVCSATASITSPVCLFCVTAYANSSWSSNLRRAAWWAAAPKTSGCSGSPRPGERYAYTHASWFLSIYSSTSLKQVGSCFLLRYSSDKQQFPSFFCLLLQRNHKKSVNKYKVTALRVFSQHTAVSEPLDSKGSAL